MTIIPFRKNQAFHPDAVRAMGIAYDNACSRLGLSQAAGNDLDRVAAEVIDVARHGERDPGKLCERVLQQLSGEPSAADPTRAAP